MYHSRAKERESKTRKKDRKKKNEKKERKIKKIRIKNWKNINSQNLIIETVPEADVLCGLKQKRCIVLPKF